MKLAQLILPINNNDGKALDFEHAELRRKLAHEFGGFTHFTACGAWQRAPGDIQNERVMVYMVAMERQQCIMLRDIAVWIANLARQESVLIVTPNGDVDFVRPAAETKPAGSVTGRIPRDPNMQSNVPRTEEFRQIRDSFTGK